MTLIEIGTISKERHAACFDTAWIIYGEYYATLHAKQKVPEFQRFIKLLPCT